MRAVEIKRICYLHNHLQKNTNINIQNSTGAINLQTFQQITINNEATKAN